MSIYARALVASACWCALWVPVSFLFQQNPHFPFALIAPVAGLCALGDRNAWDPSGNEFHELTLPWLVFWLVLVLIWFVAWKKKEPHAPYR
jgi:hypothetical protein